MWIPIRHQGSNLFSEVSMITMFHASGRDIKVQRKGKSSLKLDRLKASQIPLELQGKKPKAVPQPFTL